MRAITDRPYSFLAKMNGLFKQSYSLQDIPMACGFVDRLSLPVYAL
jgi:hypothetical protein